MDTELFTNNKTGILVQVALPEQDTAFVPAMLPPNWRMPDSLIDLSIEAWDLLGTLNGHGEVLANPEILLRPLQDREALESSKLEGTHATDQEMLLFASNPREPTSTSDRANDWREVNNYIAALHAGFEGMQTLPFCSRLIREMHEKLLRGVRGEDKKPGQFRNTIVGVGRRYIPPPPNKIDDLIHDLEKYMNEDVAKREILPRIFISHYQLEAIHPFTDGNGRVGRSLLALMIFKKCGHSMPWLYISPFFCANKDEYIKRLFRVSTHGEWTEWVEFCLRGTIAQAQDSIRRCKLLRLLRENYNARIKSSTTVRIHKLLDSLFTRPYVGVAEWKKKQGISYNTARLDIELLVQEGILRAIPDYRPATYVASEIRGIVFPMQPRVPKSIATNDPTSSSPLSVQSQTSSSPTTSLHEQGRPLLPLISPEPQLPDSSAFEPEVPIPGLHPL